MKKLAVALTLSALVSAGIYADDFCRIKVSEDQDLMVTRLCVDNKVVLILNTPTSEFVQVTDQNCKCEKVKSDGVVFLKGFLVKDSK